MAATAELFKRLENDGEPLPKRLCLARNVFQSSQMPIQRKEETVFSWMCKIAGKLRKKSKRQSISNATDADIQMIWSAVQFCVSSLHMQQLGAAEIRPSVKNNIIKVLSKHLERETLSPTELSALLECAVSILEANSFQRYFRTNIPVCMDFASLVLKSLSNLGPDNVQLCIRGITSIQSISRQTILRSELCVTFLDSALLPLIKLLKCEGSQPSPLRTEIYRCIQQVLFPKTSSDFLKFFAEIFQEIKNVADPTVNLPCSEDQHLVPFRLLRVLVEAKNLLDNDLYIGLFSTVFRAFVATYKTNSGPMIYKMAITMAYLVGFEVKSAKCNIPYFRLKESFARISEEPASVSLGILHGMTVILAQWSIPLGSEICGSSFLCWLQTLVENLFPLSPCLCPDVPFMELISTMIKLNPLIVETSVKHIIGVITEKELSEEEKPAYTTLLSNLLSMYMKLSRIPNFVTTFIVSLHDGFKKQCEGGMKLPEESEWLPVKVIDELTHCATVMPSTSSIATLNVFLDQLLKNCLQPYQCGVTQSTNFKDGFLDLFTQSICKLLCAFLRGVRMLEQCTIPQARQGYCEVMKKLKELLGLFGTILSQQSNLNSSLVCSFLSTSYCWAAEALLFEQYADVGREDLLASVGTKLATTSQTLSSTGVLSHLHPYLSSNEWEILYGKLSACEGENCKSFLLMLDLQLLSALRMFGSAESTLPQEVAKRTCEQMVEKLATMGNKQIDRSLASDVVLMAPLLTVNELTCLSDSLAACLIACEKDANVGNTISLLMDDRFLACGLICSVLSSLRRCMKTSKRKRDEAGGKLWRTSRAVLGKVDSGVIIQEETQGHSKGSNHINSLLMSLSPLVEESLISLEDDEVTELEEQFDLSNVAQHLSVLRILPLAYLSSGNQAVLFISILSVALDCLRLPSAHVKDGILKGIFDHLLLGLYERGSHLGPNLEGSLNHGILVKGLTHIVIKHNVSRRLLELVLAQSLRQEHSQSELLKKVVLLKKKERNHNPGKEDLLLGTLLMQDLSTKRLKMVRAFKTSENQDKLTSDPINTLNKARRKLASSFEILIQNGLVNSQEALHAFALTLDFNLRFDKGVDNLVPHLDVFCQTAISFLSSENAVERKAAEILILAVFRHSSKLSEHIPTFLMKDVWSLFTSSAKPNYVLVTAMFESASQEEMSFLVKDLLLKTQEAYSKNNSEGQVAENSPPNVMNFWQALLKCQNLPAVNNEISLKAMQSLLESHHSMKNLPHQQLLEFLHAVLSTIKIAMDMEMVDHCMSLLNEVVLPHTFVEFAPVAEQYLAVLSALLLHRPSQALDCIPSFIQKLKYLIKHLANESRQRSDLSRADSAQLAGLAFGIEKLVNAFTKPDKRKSFKRVAAYLIADVVAIFETITLCSAVKVHFQNIIFSLLSIVDEHAIKFLLRAMSSASTEIFKSLYDTYKKYHRFSGKV